MTDFIEQDALKSLPDTPPIRDHPHEEIKSFIATPRFDPTIRQRVRSLFFASDLKPGLHIVRKEADGLRYMFIITSNSYMDRENETITGQALKDYEDSCYPADDVFHCDNPLLWWHDDDIVMGEIVAVNYIEPLLIEVARELPNPVSKVLFDFAETNEDNAGASHRFGYREGDKSIDGTYSQIFKQESTYLPERGLAANERTYAGVLGMSSPQSDKRIDEIFQAVGIADAAKKLHAKSGELEKELAGLGISHKAFPPKKPAADGPPPAPAQAEAEDAATVEEVDAEDGAIEETEMAVADMPAFMNIMNQIYTLVMEMVDSQMGGMDQQMMFAKSLGEIREKMDANLVSEKAAKQGIEDEVKALRLEIGIIQKKLDLRGRSVTQDKGSTVEAVVEAVKNADKARIEGELKHDDFWGKLDLTKGH